MIKKGKIKFHGLVFYDQYGKPIKVVKASKEIKKDMEEYLNRKPNQKNKLQ